MVKTSAELAQKAAGYMLAAANASKREMSEKIKATGNKVTSKSNNSLKTKR